MLTASIQGFYIEQMCAYKTKRIKRLLQREAEFLERLHKENQSFEQRYQELKSQQNRQRIKSTSSFPTKKRNFLARALNFFKKKPDTFAQQYPDASPEFKKLYIRQHEIKRDYQKSLDKVCNYYRKNEQWFEETALLKLEKLQSSLKSYDNARKDSNFFIKKNPEIKHNYPNSRLAFYKKIQWTCHFLKDPDKAYYDIDIKTSRINNQYQNMVNTKKRSI